MESCLRSTKPSGKILNNAIGQAGVRSRLQPQFTCHHPTLSNKIDPSTITQNWRELLTTYVKASRLQVHVIEQRRNQRFELRLPLRVTRNGAGHAPRVALTRNISSSGILFASETEAQVGGAIEYVVTLNSAPGVDVDLRCIGKVLRLEQSSNEPQTPAYLIAATLDRYQFIRRQP